MKVNASKKNYQRQTADRLPMQNKASGQYKVSESVHVMPSTTSLTVAERIALLRSLQTKDVAERADQQATWALLVAQLGLDDAAAK